MVTNDTYRPDIVRQLVTAIQTEVSSEEDIGLLDSSYFARKYKHKLRSICEKYSNPENFDKLAMALQKSEQVKHQAQKLVNQLIDKGDRLSVVLQGLRGRLFQT